MRNRGGVERSEKTNFKSLFATRRKTFHQQLAGTTQSLLCWKMRFFRLLSGSWLKSAEIEKKRIFSGSEKDRKINLPPQKSSPLTRRSFQSQMWCYYFLLFSAWLSGGFWSVEFESRNWHSRVASSLVVAVLNWWLSITLPSDALESNCQWFAGDMDKVSARLRTIQAA